MLTSMSLACEIFCYGVQSSAIQDPRTRLYEADGINYVCELLSDGLYIWVLLYDQDGFGFLDLIRS